MIKTRFAPSPTGYIHLGNARTALFSFLLAKSQAGCFLLRIEDSDATRSLQALSEQVQVDLLWLGLPWQEGPGKAAGEGPYFQSQRQAVYEHYYQKLQDLGRAYPCFCTEQTLLMERKRQLSQGKPPRYSGVCRQLSETQVAEKKTQGKKASLRFQVLPAQTIEFYDLVKGEQAFSSDDIGDFIIQRSDGSAAFFFCNAIDDALMEVTHVLRGEDHLTNTPRQIMLLQALDLAIPAYGHMSLIVGEDGAPLSKRHGSFSLKALRELGYFPEALQNYLARLGHTYMNPAFMDMQGLSQEFSLKRLGKSPARYDNTQLLYWQKQALAQSSDNQLIAWIGEESKNLVPKALMPEFIALIRSNSSFPDEALQWAKTLFDRPLLLSNEAKSFLKSIAPHFWESADRLLEKQIAFKTFMQQLKDEVKLKGKALFSPLRMALTGRLDGPEMEKLYLLIGNEKIRERILYAKNL
ncbi:MAG: glutamate--tRNA ligase [Pseudomonadota bacterium]